MRSARAGVPPVVLSSADLAVTMNVKKRLLDRIRMQRAIRRMAIEVVERNRGIEDLLIVGIRSRGVPIGERMAKEIEQMEGTPVPFASSTSRSIATTSPRSLRSRS